MQNEEQHKRQKSGEVWNKYLLREKNRRRVEDSGVRGRNFYILHVKRNHIICKRLRLCEND